MDINTLRVIMTVLMFITFIGIFLWAWSSKTRARFNEAEKLPFNEPEHPGMTSNNKSQEVKS